MRCEEILGLLPEYLIDELPNDQGRAVRDHIARCPSCASELARMQSVAQRITQGPTGPLPDSYFSRLPGIIGKKIEESSPRFKTAGHRRHFRQVLFASGAVAAAVALVFLIIRPGERITGTNDPVDPDSRTGLAVINNLSDDELSREIGLLDLSGAGETVDLLYSAEPWEALPDISDEEWEELLDELSQERSG